MRAAGDSRRQPCRGGRVHNHPRVAGRGSRATSGPGLLDQGFWLSLRWVPAADSQSVDEIIRPARIEIIRLKKQPRSKGRGRSWGNSPLTFLHRPRLPKKSLAMGTGEQQELPFYMFVRGRAVKGRLG